jgi:CYTH domain-containing protein
MNQQQATVRVRIAGDRAFLTLKGATTGITRLEFEYEIPVGDADTLLTELCQAPLIEKTRYRIPIGNHTWEVDEFWGDNAGLIVAEVELKSADEPIELPAWVGQEVSNDPRYYNANLVQHPYCTW